VQGADTARSADLKRQRELVEAFLAAAREGDFGALLAVLDPNVVLRADRAAVPPGLPTELRGASAVVEQALRASRRARFSQVALVDGAAAIILAPRGRLSIVMTFKIAGQRVTEIEVIADPERLRRLDLAVLGD
jgi:RNA polymerase sigma-70 factor (ECF subfamily)